MIVTVNDLRKAYQGRSVLEGVSFNVSRGQCFGLLGPNGAGKTTTFEILEGLIPADAGKVRVLGYDPARQPRSLQARLGVQLQGMVLFDRLTVAEMLGFFADLYGCDRAASRDLLRRLDLAGCAHLTAGRLSGGLRQRVALALALVNDPEVLFLDEPTTGLDPESRRSLWDHLAGLKAEGRTLLVTTHYLEEAERFCDQVAFLHRGRLAARGTPGEVAHRFGARDLETAYLRCLKEGQSCPEEGPSSQEEGAPA